MQYSIILENEEDGRCSAHCPELVGCHSWGNNEEEEIVNIREAITGYLEVIRERKELA
jgi:predicted RNase H-like HicB family nuclease